MNDATTIIFGIAILVMSVVIHEVSHGIAAYLLGDKTAKYSGRLTLNPLPHLDPFGSVLLPALLAIMQSPFLIGWAKPVPFNPYNLHRAPKWGPGIVAAAGPLSNILIALIFGLIIRIGALDIVPFAANFYAVIQYIILINIVLAVFNLIPIPPLDGSKVLFTLLPYQYRAVAEFLELWGFALLIVVILFAGPLISTVVEFLFTLITGIV